MIYDLEGSNNVDTLVSGFGQIYLTVKYICLVEARPTPCARVQRSTQGVPIISQIFANGHATIRLLVLRHTTIQIH